MQVSTTEVDNNKTVPEGPLKYLPKYMMYHIETHSRELNLNKRYNHV